MLSNKLGMAMISYMLSMHAVSGWSSRFYSQACHQGQGGTQAPKAPHWIRHCYWTCFKSLLYILNLQFCYKCTIQQEIIFWLRNTAEKILFITLMWGIIIGFFHKHNRPNLGQCSKAYRQKKEHNLPAGPPNIVHVYTVCLHCAWFILCCKGA